MTDLGADDGRAGDRIDCIDDEADPVRRRSSAVGRHIGVAVGVERKSGPKQLRWQRFQRGSVAGRGAQRQTFGDRDGHPPRCLGTRWGTTAQHLPRGGNRRERGA